MVEFEHGYIQRVYDEYYAKAQTVPQNTSADGNGGAKKNSGAMGGISVTAIVNEDITIADTQSIKVTVQDCDTEAGSYTEIGTVCDLTSSGATTYKAGEALGRFILPPEAKKWTKAVIATTDAAATGKIDVVSEMIPR